MPLLACPAVPHLFAIGTAGQASSGTLISGECFMPKLIDLSHPLAHGQLNFPFDPKISVLVHNTIASIGYNMTQISMATHQGTHLDVPYHFYDDGKTVDQMPLDRFYGPAALVDLAPGACLRGEDADHAGNARAARGEVSARGESDLSHRLGPHVRHARVFQRFSHADAGSGPLDRRAPHRPAGHGHADAQHRLERGPSDAARKRTWRS